MSLCCKPAPLPIRAHQRRKNVSNKEITPSGPSCLRSSDEYGWTTELWGWWKTAVPCCLSPIAAVTSRRPRWKLVGERRAHYATERKIVLEVFPADGAAMIALTRRMK
jgi:hypothetical protein